MTEPRIVVCIKWVATRPDIDPLTGDVAVDPRFSGVSAADHTALELGLRLASALGGQLTVLTVGPPDADAALRDALAAGATSALRLEPGNTEPADSAAVAAALATVCAGASVVLCGDYSLDRGTGSVPSFLASELGASQALGVVAVSTDLTDICEPLVVTRRLDQARRETLEVSAPAVISVEPSLELRRASLRSLLAHHEPEVEVIPIDLDPARLPVVATGPHRPRARVIAPPEGSTRDRLLTLSGAQSERTPPKRLELPPDEAAAVAIEHLQRWGYLEP